MPDSNVVELRRPGALFDIPESTYGALAESNITALDALMAEVRRTNAHVLWLEHYVSQLPQASLFGEAKFAPQQEAEWAAKGQRPAEGSIGWTLAIERAKNMGIQQPKTKSIHLAVQQLMKERQHLLAVCQAAIKVGIALDEIELAKQHGEMIVTAMTQFATEMGLDPTDKNVVKAILDALDSTTG
jgi:hypothetical protein